MGALAEQLERRGVIPREVSLKSALSLFFNNGGSVERAHALIDSVAEQMGSGGRSRHANGHPTIADASQPNESAGRTSIADKALVPVPALSTLGNGAGHPLGAGKVRDTSPRPVSHVYIAAARTGANKLALTVLDSFKVRDGRSIGDVPWSGLARMIGANAREAAVLRMVRDNIGGMPADPNTRLRDLVTATDLERIIQKAAEVEDAH
jgi:hypothetical protein